LLGKSGLAFFVGVAITLLSGTRLLCTSGFLASNNSVAEFCRSVGCWESGCESIPGVAFPSGAANSSVSVRARRLTENPASARLWLSAGKALFLENEINHARYCYERSVDLAPHSPPVLVEAAAFFYATGSRDQGLALSSRTLSLTRDYDRDIFPLYDRLVDTSTILSRGLPHQRSAAQAYLAHALTRKDAADAKLAWEWLVRHDFADHAVLRRYLTRLLEQDRFDDAALVAWNYLPPAERPAGAERVHHGGFEAEPGVPPLGWVVTPIDHAEVRRDNSTAWEGTWSLRVEFDGQANLEYRHVAQLLVVTPGRWKLSARVRTAGVTTDQGVGLRLFDARSASRWQIWTDSVRGDSEWQLIETGFSVPSETRLLRVEVARRPSQRLDNKLGGVCWIDAVSLTPL
jgi:hypothetical protein